MRSRDWILCLTVVLAGAVTVRSSLAQTTSGSWSGAAPLPGPLESFAAAAGTDGYIYVFGGSTTSRAPLNTAEVYDPVTNRWSALAPMPTARLGLAAATGPDGRIYVMGGFDGAILNTVEACNPSTNTWSTVAPLPTPRDFPAAAAGPDGRIYVMGGAPLTARVDAYDPASNTWAEMASMPTARVSAAATVGLDRRVYVIGGFTDKGASSAVEAYDPATDTWRTLASLPTPTDALAAATGSDGRIYAIGGVISDGLSSTDYLNTVEVYDPSTNTWSMGAPMPTSRAGLAAVRGSDGRIYAIGGFIRIPSGNVSVPSDLSTVEVYTTGGPPTLVPTTILTVTPSPTPAPRVAVASRVAPVPGQPGAATASLSVSFSSALPGQGEVYFGSGPGCLGLVEVATEDLHPGSTQHTVVVTGNDLPGTVGNDGIIPGVTYWFEVVTVTSSGMDVDNNNGHCYSVTVPT